MASENLKQKFEVETLRYYFDGIEHDIQTRGRLNLRISEWLRIRDRLLQLPLALYESTMKTIEALVEQQLREQGRNLTSTAPQDGAAQRSKGKVVGGQRLFEAIENEHNATVPRASIDPRNSIQR